MPTIPSGGIMNIVKPNKIWALFLVAGLAGPLGGCAPTIKVAAEEPITINLNVKIEHEVRIKVDKELDDLFSEDSGLF
jgi:predicted transcriptional regulator